MNFTELDSLLASKSKVDYASKLNEEQIQAVETINGPVLIIAGAGSGKTLTLTYRVAHIIDTGVNPESILTLTFTNKAAREMVSRCKKILDERASKVTACTYHSFCANVLRRYSKSIGLDPSFTILDSTDESDALKLMKEYLQLSKDSNLPNGKELLSIISASINKCEDIDDIVYNEFPKYMDYTETIKKINKRYIDYKLEKNLVDYDDLLVLMNKLLSTNEDACRHLSDRYQYIMVDEYQDSNLLQFQMLQHLRKYENKNICVVGDDQQCIYGFRGSRFENIINFPNQFANCKVVILNKNYRSNQEILDLSNAIIANAKQKYEKNLIGTHKKGELPKLVVTKDSFDESRYVLNKIIGYVNDGVQLSDIAVLMRGSNDSYELESLIAQISSQLDIPYQKFGGIKFLERAHIKDIFAFLKIMINPSDEIAWFRVFQLYPNIGPVTARKITAGIFENGIEELINKKHVGKKYGENLPGLYNMLKLMETLDFQAQLSYIMNDYYYGVVKKTIKDMKTGENTRREKIKELDQNIEDSQILLEMASGYKSAHSFLTDMTLDAADDKKNTEKLTISTIHSAKGLEFKVVFVLDAVEGTFPWVKPPKANTEKARKDAEDAIEEERRVFYVAITRAKEDLYVIYPQITRKYGDFNNNEISRFLYEDNIYENYMTLENCCEY